MSLVVSEVYEAFKHAGVPDGKARQAAEAVADINPRLLRIETKMRVLHNLRPRAKNGDFCSQLGSKAQFI